MFKIFMIKCKRLLIYSRIRSGAIYKAKENEENKKPQEPDLQY